MKECFCGCGRSVRRFPLGMRSINRRGAQVVDRLYEVERRGGRDKPELAAWFDDGEDIVSALTGVVHGEVDPRSVDERAVREWQAQGRAIAPSKMQAQAQLGRAIRQSGLSADQAAAAIARGMQQGMTPEETIEALARDDLR